MNPSRASVCGLAVLFFATVIAPTFAAAPDSFDAQLSFGDFLMLQKRYSAAELEFERLAALYPDHPRRDEAISRMLNAALQTHDAAFTLNLARAWAERTEGRSKCLASLYVVQSLYQLENYPRVLAETFPTSCPEETRSKYYYVRGLSRLRLEDWPAAPQEFEQVSSSSSWRAMAEEASATSSREASLSSKSPALAGSLSAVLPGSGYLYSDRPQTAVAAFVVTGLFIGGTYSAVHGGESGVAALLALLSLGWYSGGIYGSVQAAHRENDLQLDRFLRPLEIRW